MPDHIWTAHELAGLAAPYEIWVALGSWHPSATSGNSARFGERRCGEVGQVAEEEASDERSPFWGSGEEKAH
jgi:hypothetical protein